MSQDPEELWARCLLIIEQRLRSQSFNTWFRPTTERRFDRASLEIEVSSTYFADWVESNYLGLISSVVNEVTDFQPQITFHVFEKDQPIPDPAASRNETHSSSETAVEQLELPHLQTVPSEGSGSSTSLNERYTFDTFVIGEFNRFAHAAAWAVAKSPGKTQFNPLVIYGGVGLGKTHLLQAIGHDALNRKTANQVTFVASEKFLSDFIEAIRNQSTADFQRRYRSADILLVDDIQFLLKGEQTRNEFFHTFNALVDQNRQVVVSADKSPNDLEGLEERLRSRLGWGLVADIHPTTYELRLGILQSKVDKTGVHVPVKVLEFLAHKITSNVRELEGAMNRITAHATLVGRDITLETTQEVLHDLLRAYDRRITVEEIQRQVASHYQVRMGDMHSARRSRAVARPRQIAMYLSKQLTQHSLPDIGRRFGGRDHTTVLHAVKKVDELCAVDVSFRDDVEFLKRMLET